MFLWIGYRNLDAQYSTSGVLFGEIGTLAAVLTNACLCAFLVLFLVFFFPFWRHCWVLLHSGSFLATEAEISSRKPELLHRCGYRSFWRSWSVFRALRCYSNMGTYVVTAVFSGFTLTMYLTYTHSRNPWWNSGFTCARLCTDLWRHRSCSTMHHSGRCVWSLGRKNTIKYMKYACLHVNVWFFLKKNFFFYLLIPFCQT